MSSIVMHVPSRDGGLALQIVQDSRTLEEAKADRVLWLKGQAAERIEHAWPMWRQLNTIRAGGEALAAMEAEIDGIRAASNAAEAAVMAADTRAAVNAIEL